MRDKNIIIYYNFLFTKRIIPTKAAKFASFNGAIFLAENISIKILLFSK